MSNSISRNIKELRNGLNISQEELSERSGVSLRTIQRIENGNSEARGETLKCIAIGLNLPPKYFEMSMFSQKTGIITEVFNQSKKWTTPWYLIGFTLSIGSFGFLTTLFIVIHQLEHLNPYYEFVLPIIVGITILFVGLGIILGNYFEKKSKSKKE